MTTLASFRSARRRVLRGIFERGRLKDTYGVVSLDELERVLGRRGRIDRRMHIYTVAGPSDAP